VEELKSQILFHEATVVIFDRDLTPPSSATWSGRLM